MVEVPRLCIWVRGALRLSLLLVELTACGTTPAARTLDSFTSLPVA